MAWTLEQLTWEPDVETRNRKPVRAPAAFNAEWELRFGPNDRFRVFYQLDYGSREVLIVATGVKDPMTLAVLCGRIKTCLPSTSKQQSSAT